MSYTLTDSILRINNLEMEEEKKEFIKKEFNKLTNLEIDTLYLFLESMIPSMNKEEVEDIELLLDLLENKELRDEKI